MEPLKKGHIVPCREVIKVKNVQKSERLAIVTCNRLFPVQLLSILTSPLTKAYNSAVEWDMNLILDSMAP